MTPTLNIAELEKLARVATPGPWAYDQCGDVWTTQETDNLADIGEVFRAIGTTPTAPDNPNAAFIASANPQTILTLIAALREAMGVVREVTGMVDDFSGSDCIFCRKNHPGHSRDLHDAGCFFDRTAQTLHSIAEKVEGL